MRRQWCVPTVLALMYFAPAGTAAEPEKLPDGATLRLGTSQGKFGPNVLLLPPDYTTALASDGSALMKYDLATWKLLEGKVGTMTQIPTAVTSDGKRAVSANVSGFVVWNLTDGKKIATRAVRNGYGKPTAFTPDGKFLAVGGFAELQDKTTKVTATVYDAETGAEVAVVSVKQNQTSSVALSDDGKRLVTWGSHYNPADKPNSPENPQNQIQVWDVAEKKEVATIKVEFTPQGVALSPNGKTVAVVSNGRVILWSADTGERTATFLARSQIGRTLRFSPSGKTLAAVCYDGAIQRWNVADGTILGVVPAPTGSPLAVSTLVIASDDQALVTASCGRRSIVWEVPSGKVLLSGEGHGEGIQALAFRGGGKEIVTGSSLSTIFRWDAGTGKRLPDIRIGEPTPYYNPENVKLSVDGTKAFSSLTGRYFDTGTGIEALFIRPQSYQSSYQVSLSPDGTKLGVLATEVTQKAKLARAFGVDLATGKQSGEVVLPAGSTGSGAAAVSPDGTKLLTAMTTQPNGKSELSVAGWNLKDGKSLSNMVFDGGFQTPYVVTASDNATAAVCTPAGKLFVVDFVAGKTLRDLSPKQTGLSCCPVFDAECKRLAYALPPRLPVEDRAKIYVVEVATGKPLNEFRGHSRNVTALLFAPDGKTLVSGSEDTTALVWDLSAGNPSGN